MKKKKRFKAKPKTSFCQAPDRHEPRLTCGYPLPCPHHNVRKVVKVGVIVR